MIPAAIPLAVRMLRMPDVLKLTGFTSPDTIYRLVRAGTFPAPRKLTARSSAWRSDEIDEWITSRPALGGADRSERRPDTVAGAR
jgi:predicted DNA-binding transcriptional regulator AlpA